MRHLLILNRPTVPERPDLGPLLVERATPDDARAFAQDIGTYDADAFRVRLSAENLCFLGIEDGRVLHSSWCSRGATWTEELGTYLAPPAHDAYVYESQTVPAARGRGIYPLVLGAIASDLHQEGVGQLWIGVESTNEASVRAIRKAGFLDVFSIGFEHEGDRVMWQAPHVDPADSLHIVTERPIE